MLLTDLPDDLLLKIMSFFLPESDGVILDSQKEVDAFVRRGKNNIVQHQAFQRAIKSAATMDRNIVHLMSVSRHFRNILLPPKLERQRNNILTIRDTVRALEHRVQPHVRSFKKGRKHQNFIMCISLTSIIILTALAFTDTHHAEGYMVAAVVGYVIFMGVCCSRFCNKKAPWKEEEVAINVNNSLQMALLGQTDYQSIQDDNVPRPEELDEILIL